MDTVIGVDVGTSSAKAVVADSSGTILGQHSSAEYAVISPQPLWAEQMPDVWFKGLVEAVTGALARAKVDKKSVRAITVSGLYGGSGVPVDADMRAVRPCLIWMDRRAGAETEWVARVVPPEELFAVTGNGADSYYGFTKMLWIKRHEPEAWGRIRYFLPPHSEFIYRLTGKVAVDLASAGNVGGVFDLAKRGWSAAMCDALGIPKAMLPERLVTTSEAVGGLNAEGARLLGLPEGLPVFSGGIDAAVATLSAGVFREGQHAAMIGTSMCWGFIHAGAPASPGLISMPYVLDDRAMTYTFGGAATAGAVIRWFRDTLGEAEETRAAKGGPSAYELLAAEAGKIAAGSEGLIALPYFMGERTPIWDINARGTVTGLTLSHTKAHLYRAMLEGVAYALEHNIEFGLAGNPRLEEALTVVGGAAKSELWLEIIANVTGRPVRGSADAGEAAYGDAMLAAHAIGLIGKADLPVWTDKNLPNRFRDPRPADRDTYRSRYRAYRELYDTLRPYFAAQANAAG